MASMLFQAHSLRQANPGTPARSSASIHHDEQGNLAKHILTMLNGIGMLSSR
jgi:hypothetical protein